MAKIEPLERDHLPQVMDLVNAHLGAVVPGWALTACYIWERLKRNPAEYVTDPWVVERKSIVGVVNDRVCAAAHILRYGNQTPRKGTAEVAWLLFWPRERTAGEAILNDCLRQMKAWQVTDQLNPKFRGIIRCRPRRPPGHPSPIWFSSIRSVHRTGPTYVHT